MTIFLWIHQLFRIVKYQIQSTITFTYGAKIRKNILFQWDKSYKKHKSASNNILIHDLQKNYYTSTHLNAAQKAILIRPFPIKYDGKTFCTRSKYSHGSYTTLVLATLITKLILLELSSGAYRLTVPLVLGIYLSCAHLPPSSECLLKSLD